MEEKIEKRHLALEGAVQAVQNATATATPPTALGAQMAPMMALAGAQPPHARQCVSWVTTLLASAWRSAAADERFQSQLWCWYRLPTLPTAYSNA